MRAYALNLPFKNTLFASRGWGLALLTILFFSIQPTAAKIVLNAGLTPEAQLALRYGFSTLLFFVTIGLQAPQRLQIDRCGLLICVGAGLILSVGTLAFTASLLWIDTSIASMLFATYPLVVLVVLALRGESFTYRNIVRLLLGLVGVYLLVGPGGQVASTGVLLVLTACFIFALYIVTLQYLKDYHPQTLLFYLLAAKAVAFIVLWLIRGAAWPGLDASGWLGLAILVVICTYLAQQCLFGAVRLIGSGQMALLNPIEPFLTVFWSSLILHERLSPLQWAGSSLIILSMFLAIKRIGCVNDILSGSLPRG
jgi:drug/metabolite transporter (DMT)-like permease